MGAPSLCRGRQVPSSVRTDAGITFTFDRGTLRDRGTMFDSTGRNDYRVAYEHSITRNGPDRLVMAEPAVTKQRCVTGDASGLEQRFLGILRDVGYYPDITADGRKSLDTADGRKFVFSAPE